MKKSKLYFHIITTIVSLLTFNACNKNQGDYDYVNQTAVFKGNIYEYLKSKPGVFDSLLFVIDKLKLSDTLKNNKITLFACTNESFQQVVTKLNTARKLVGKPPVYLNDVTPNLLDSMVCRYIIRGRYLADSLYYNDGLTIRGMRYNYPMNGKFSAVNATGFVGGGPAKLIFSYTKRSLFVIDWVRANATAINVGTNNGVVHILESSHPFGFGDYTKPVPTPFALSTFRPAGYSGPFQFPSTIGTSVLIEAEDYDSGGEGISYHDLDANNNGGNYRVNEGVDVYAPTAAGSDAAGAYPSSYNVGNTNLGEWILYSINVPVEGDFTITTRAGTNAAVKTAKAFHFEFDYKNLTGVLSLPFNGNYNAWVMVVSPVFHLKQGTHSMKFAVDINDFNFNNFIVKRVN